MLIFFFFFFSRRRHFQKCLVTWKEKRNWGMCAIRYNDGSNRLAVGNHFILIILYPFDLECNLVFFWIFSLWKKTKLIMQVYIVYICVIHGKYTFVVMRTNNLVSLVFFLFRWSMIMKKKKSLFGDEKSVLVTCQLTNVLFFSFSLCIGNRNNENSEERDLNNKIK